MEDEKRIEETLDTAEPEARELADSELDGIAGGADESEYRDGKRIIVRPQIDKNGAN